MHRSMQVFHRITFGLFIGLLMVCAVSCDLYDVKGSSQEAPAVDQGYLLGPEDVLLISVWKDEQLTREVVVRPDGMISFPSSVIWRPKARRSRSFAQTSPDG